MDLFNFIRGFDKVKTLKPEKGKKGELDKSESEYESESESESQSESQSQSES